MGNENAARVPSPSAHAAIPLPAKTLTVPLGETSLSLLLLASPTKTVPLLSTAMPRGTLKIADSVPKPLEKLAAPVPASVVTKPEKIILRIRLFPVSAT